MKDTQECHYPEPGRLSEKRKAGLGNWFPLGQQKANLAAAAAAHQGPVNPLHPGPGSACAAGLLLPRPHLPPAAGVMVVAPGPATEPALLLGKGREQATQH